MEYNNMANVIALLKSLVPVTNVSVTKVKGSYTVTIERIWLGRSTKTVLKAADMV